jgi:hypothetical protein
MWIVGVCTAGCAGNDSRPVSRSPETILKVLDAIGNGSAIYGFGYTSPPPAGERLLLSLHHTDTRAACARYRSGADGSDFWYVKLEASQARSGTYSIGKTAEMPASATVKLIDVVAGEKQATFRATEGTLAITAPEQPFTSEVTFEVAASFPTRQSAVGTCNATGTAQGVVHSDCTCDFNDGSSSTCESANGDDCCLDATGGRLGSLSLRMSAEFCPWMCVVSSPELAQFCPVNGL